MQLKETSSGFFHARFIQYDLHCLTPIGISQYYSCFTNNCFVKSSIQIILNKVLSHHYPYVINQNIQRNSKSYLQMESGFEFFGDLFLFPCLFRW